MTSVQFIRQLMLALFTYCYALFYFVRLSANTDFHKKNNILYPSERQSDVVILVSERLS